MAVTSARAIDALANHAASPAIPAAAIRHRPFKASAPIERHPPSANWVKCSATCGRMQANSPGGVLSNWELRNYGGNYGDGAFSTIVREVRSTGHGGGANGYPGSRTTQARDVGACDCHNALPGERRTG